MQPMVFYTLAALAGALIGGVMAWLWGRSRQIILEERVHSQQRELEQTGRVRFEAEQLRIRVAELAKEREADAEKLQWKDQAEGKFREAFNALAGQVLQSNSEQFLNRAREQLTTLLTGVRGDWNVQKVEMQKIVQPVEITLKALDAHVRELEQKREGAYKGLDAQLRQLGQAHQQMQTATIKLEQALKSPTIRGSWGQIQLRRVVEMAGMESRVAFDEQATGDEGRPDMVVHLPNHTVLPIDAKAPMQAFLEAMETTDADTRRVKMAAHAEAVRRRVRELSQKKYWEQFDRAPEFVVMFVPNETCLSAAFEHDPTLLEYGFEQRVLLTSPVTLLALLKAVSYGWQQQQIAENSREIAEQGKELYDRLSRFVDHLRKAGSGLDSAVKSYNDAIGSLESRVLPSGRRFKELGVATAELPTLEPLDRQVREPGISPKTDALQSPDL
ncbi:MAG: DNA recombination protein RmuC [Verrucomicrobia bacterium]|nr:DNA recombination protein RmuC [Verrucomicrobiota bacterium]